jgi:hypothetical protein
LGTGAREDETVTIWKFGVEGESGLECDERIEAGCWWAGDQVVAKATRRRFTVEYKRKIAREADA